MTKFYTQHYGITSTGSRQMSTSIIKHKALSQAYASSHLFHPIARLIQFFQRSPRQLIFTVHNCCYPYQLRTNETESTLNRMTLNKVRQGLITSYHCSRPAARLISSRNVVVHSSSFYQEVWTIIEVCYGGFQSTGSFHPSYSIK